jgi:hypothetical protein
MIENPFNPRPTLTPAFKLIDFARQRDSVAGLANRNLGVLSRGIR